MNCQGVLGGLQCEGAALTAGNLSRKKAQQEVARKQVMEARKEGYDVEGRGESGPSGRQPRAEMD